MGQHDDHGEDAEASVDGDARSKTFSRPCMQADYVLHASSSSAAVYSLLSPFRLWKNIIFLYKNKSEKHEKKFKKLQAFQKYKHVPVSITVFSE